MIVFEVVDQRESPFAEHIDVEFVCVSGRNTATAFDVAVLERDAERFSIGERFVLVPECQIEATRA